MSTESDCWKVIEVGVQAFGVVITALAAFAGAFFAYRFSRYQRAHEEFEQDVNLLNATIAVCAIQLGSLNNRHKELQAEHDAVTDLVKSASAGGNLPSTHTISFTPLHSQRDAFLRINSAMLAGRLKAEVYERLSFVDLHLLNLEQHFEVFEKFVKQLKEFQSTLGAVPYLTVNSKVAKALEDVHKEVTELKALCFKWRGTLKPPSIFWLTSSESKS